MSESKAKQTEDKRTSENNSDAGNNESIENSLKEINKKLANVITKDDDSLRGMMTTLINDMKTDLLKSFEHKIEVLESALHDSRQENEQLQKRIENLEKTCENEKDKASQKTVDMRNVTLLQGGKLNDLEQYSRRNSLKIAGIPETTNTGKNSYETAEQSTKKVIEKLNSTIECLNLNTSDIDISHRVGKKYKDKHRQILVKFVSRHVRDKVMMNRRVFKGTQIFINEDLTKLNQHVLGSIRKSIPESEAVWTWGGSIFHKSSSGKIQPVPFTSYKEWLGVDWDKSILGQRLPT
ncbi:girdin-like [Mya arenaria]|uniref:girdin-like n=1 Tax=Mya arenaria TaxID=6604 RepID=UPI0022DF5476|nr:girdin-like [Mya arenaria]